MSFGPPRSQEHDVGLSLVTLIPPPSRGNKCYHSGTRPTDSALRTVPGELSLLLLLLLLLFGYGTQLDETSIAREEYLDTSPE